MVAVGFLALGAVLAGLGIAGALRTADSLRRLLAAQIVAAGAATGLVAGGPGSDRGLGATAALIVVVVVAVEVAVGMALVMVRAASEPREEPRREGRREGRRAGRGGDPGPPR